MTSLSISNPPFSPNNLYPHHLPDFSSPYDIEQGIGISQQSQEEKTEVRSSHRAINPELIEQINQLQETILRQEDQADELAERRQESSEKHLTRLATALITTAFGASCYYLYPHVPQWINWSILVAGACASTLIANRIFNDYFHPNPEEENVLKSIEKSAQTLDHLKKQRRWTD